MISNLYRFFTLTLLYILTDFFFFLVQMVNPITNGNQAKQACIHRNEKGVVNQYIRYELYRQRQETKKTKNKTIEQQDLTSYQNKRLCNSTMNVLYCCASAPPLKLQSSYTLDPVINN